MCEYRYCRGRKAVVTQISSFAVSSSQYPYQETYQFAAEKVCLKCGRVFRRHIPHGKWTIGKEESPQATKISNTVKTKTWFDSMLSPDSIISTHSTFYSLHARLLTSIPFFIPFIIVMLIMLPSHLFSWWDAVSIATIIAAVLYLLFSNPRNIKECFVKNDGTVPPLRFPTEDFLDV